jgi:hypothetical protein
LLEGALELVGDLSITISVEDTPHLHGWLGEHLGLDLAIKLSCVPLNVEFVGGSRRSGSHDHVSSVVLEALEFRGNILELQMPSLLLLLALLILGESLEETFALVDLPLDARMIMKEKGALLNVDVAFRCVRTDSLLDYMNQVRDKAEQKGKDWQEALKDAIENSTVVTRYNQKTYRVERIDFSMSPDSTFEKTVDDKPVQISYKEYYNTRYKETIKDSNQPLLINKDRKTGNEIALIPELCQLTGLTDVMRADFRLMKDLAQIVHTNAERKINECKGLFKTFTENEKCKEKQQAWHLKFKDVPAEL